MKENSVTGNVNDLVARTSGNEIEVFIRQCVSIQQSPKKKSEEISSRGGVKANCVIVTVNMARQQRPEILNAPEVG